MNLMPMVSENNVMRNYEESRHRSLWPRLLAPNCNEKRLRSIWEIITLRVSNRHRDRTRSLQLLFLPWSSPDPSGAARHPG